MAFFLSVSRGAECGEAAPRILLSGVDAVVIGSQAAAGKLAKERVAQAAPAKPLQQRGEILRAGKPFRLAFDAVEFGAEAHVPFAADFQQMDRMVAYAVQIGAAVL